MGFKNSFDCEKQALTGNHTAMIRVISNLRSYRDACKNLLSKRHEDGEVDCVALDIFEREITEIDTYFLEDG